MRPDMAEPAPSYILHATMSLPHAPNESAILSSKDENGWLPVKAQVEACHTRGQSTRYVPS